MKINNSYKLIETEDGSVSVFSESFGQLMHAREGALTEAIYSHILPSGVLNRKSDEINVLDVGFGAGYNPLALIIESRKKAFNKINIISLEYDKSCLKHLEEIKFDDYTDVYYKFLLNAFSLGSGGFENVEIKFVYGDARLSIQKLAEEGLLFDSICFDPFSPVVNPEMWTVDLFKKIYMISKKDAFLTTYSSAVHIRRALLEAGFKIGELISVKSPKTGTIARKEDFTFSLNSEEIDLIYDNIRSIPFRDPEFTLTREEIIENRLKERKEIKSQNKSFS